MNEPERNALADGNTVEKWRASWAGLYGNQSWPEVNAICDLALIALRAGEAGKPNMERMHGLVEQLAGRFKGYLPWPEELRDSVVKGHEMAIEDILRKADAIALAAPSAQVNEGRQGRPADISARTDEADPADPSPAGLLRDALSPLPPEEAHGLETILLGRT